MKNDIAASAHPTLCICVETEGHININTLYLKQSDWKLYCRRNRSSMLRK